MKLITLKRWQQDLETWDRDFGGWILLENWNFQSPVNHPGVAKPSLVVASEKSHPMA